MPLSSVLGAQSLVRPGVCTSSTRPASPFEGQLIYETDTKQTLVYSGAAWVMLADASAPPGLQLIKTQTIGTTVSSVEVTDAFSADYDDYRIIVVGGVASTTVNLRLSLGTTTTGYYYGGRYADYSGAGVGQIQGANVGFWVVGSGSSISLISAFDIMNPFLTDETMFSGQYGDALTNGAAVYVGGFLNNTTSYTAFTITPSSGTLTGGIIKVYGYRNS